MSLAECEKYFLREVPQRLWKNLSLELGIEFHISKESLQTKREKNVKTVLANSFTQFRQQYQTDETPINPTSSQPAPFQAPICSIENPLDQSEVYLGLEHPDPPDMDFDWLLHLIGEPADSDSLSASLAEILESPAKEKPLIRSALEI